MPHQRQDGPGLDWGQDQAAHLALAQAQVQVGRLVAAAFMALWEAPDRGREAAQRALLGSSSGLT